jgi:large subunit ribosomal protein L19
MVFKPKQLIAELERQQMKEGVTPFSVGDTVRVQLRIIEGGKERIQAFQGTVIGRKGGGVNESFTLHRHIFGEGIERVFLVHSPRLASIEVLKRGRVRRAKLNYLRGTKGRRSKVADLHE